MIHMFYKIREPQAEKIPNFYRHVARGGGDMNAYLFRIVNDMYETKVESIHLIFKDGNE